MTSRSVGAACLWSVVMTLLSTPALADTRAELWTEVGAEVDPVDDLELSWASHLRFADGPPRLSRWLNDLGVSYRLNKSLRVAVGYRLVYRPEAEAPCCRHRPHVQASVRAKLGKLRADMRWRFQTRLQLDRDPRYIVRDRLTLQWRGSKKVRPYVAGEVFVRLLDVDQAVRFDTLRLDVGFDYRGFDHVTLGTYYRIELPGDFTDDTVHIVGLSAAFR